MSNRRRWIAVLAILAAVSTSAWAQSEEGQVISTTRDALAKWVETQQVISKEREAWKLGREVLEQRISLVSGEISGLRDKIAEAEKNIGDTDAKRDELVAEKGQLRDASSSLEDRIVVLEDKTRRLVRSLPDPIADRIGPLAQRIPSDSTKTELALSERYQNVIGVLNEINKFNRDVTLTSEVRKMPDGSSAEVQALYLGLGAAYYVTSDASAAGYGKPTPEGWEWTQANDLAPQIGLAIKIMQNEEVPAFVPLPVTVQ